MEVYATNYLHMIISQNIPLEKYLSEINSQSVGTQWECVHQNK